MQDCSLQYHFYFFVVVEFSFKLKFKKISLQFTKSGTGNPPLSAHSRLPTYCFSPLLLLSTMLQHHVPAWALHPCYPALGPCWPWGAGTGPMLKPACTFAATRCFLPRLLLLLLLSTTSPNLAKFTDSNKRYKETSWALRRIRYSFEMSTIVKLH